MAIVLGATKRGASAGLRGVGVLGLLMGALSVMSAEIRREVLALEGGPAPGGFAGETFGPLERVRARVNARGDVIFVAPVRGVRANGTSVDGLFLQTDRELIRLAQEDAPIPGMDGLRFGKMSRVAINDAGNVLVFQDAGDWDGYLSNASGAWRVVARSDDPNPALVRFHRFSNLSSSHEWQPLLRSAEEPDVLFPALPTAFGGQSGFPGTWEAGADGWNPQALFEEGRQAPELSNVALLAEMKVRTLGSAPAWRSIFAGYLLPAGDPPVFTNLNVLWTQSGRGSVRVMARSGDRARVPVANVFYQEFRGATVNGAGTVAFIAGMVPEDSGYATALFVGTPDNYRAVVRDGDTILGSDGQPLGPVLLMGSPVLNETGQVVFRGVVGDREVLGRWTPDGRLDAVVFGRQSWAGAPDGWQLGSIYAVNFNASGRLAVVADMGTPELMGVSWGLWVTDARSEPVLVAMASWEPSTVTPPAGVPLLSEGFEIPVLESAAGGGDGLPRFFSDGQHVVYSGRPVGGPSGVFRVSVDAGVAPPADETFRWAPRDLGIWGGLTATEPDSWAIRNPARLFPDAGLFARQEKDWTGARLVLEVSENGDPAHDIFGLDHAGLARQKLEWVETTADLTYAGRALGRMSRPRSGVLEVALDPEATSDGIRGLVRVLALGSTRDLGEVLRNDARHVEPRKRILLTLTDSAGRSAEMFQTVDFPKVEGLAFEGLSLRHNSWASGYTESTTLTLKPQLRLSDGSRILVGCSPVGAQMQWFPNSLATGVVRATSTDGPCADITMTYDGLGGFPSLLRLHSWQAQHILRRETNFEDVFTRGLGVCVGTFFSLWLDTQPWTHGAAAGGRSLMSVEAESKSSASPTNTLATDLQAGPYALRDWMRRSEAGRRWIGLYEQHTGEVVQRMLTDFELFNDVLSLLHEFSPGLRAFLSGKGQDAILRPDMVAQVNRIWDQLEAKGSPALRAVIRDERARYHGLEDFVGRTFEEWGELLGIGAPETPFVTASSPRLNAGVFRVEANRVAGMMYSLWRRSAERSGIWEAVADAGMRVLDATVELWDPRPPSDAQLYQVRTQSP